MRIIELDKQKECHSWGYQNENGATILVKNLVDFKAFDATKIVVLFQRKDGHPYIHNFTIDGDNLFVTLNAVDTQLIGKCEIQINYVNGNRIIKEKNYRSFILPQALEEDLPLTEESIMALDNLKNYVEEAKMLLEKAEKYSQEIIFVNTLPENGEFGKIYIDKNTNEIYYWNENNFIKITQTFDYIDAGDASSNINNNLVGEKMLWLQN